VFIIANSLSSNMDIQVCFLLHKFCHCLSLIHTVSQCHLITAVIAWTVHHITHPELVQYSNPQSVSCLTGRKCGFFIFRLFWRSLCQNMIFKRIHRVFCLLFRSKIYLLVQSPADFCGFSLSSCLNLRQLPAFAVVFSCIHLNQGQLSLAVVSEVQ